MKNKPLTVFAVAVGLLVVSGPMFAHHGSAAYETTKKTTVKGTVTNFEFINPHTEIDLDVKDDNNNVEKWRAEAGSPNLLARWGWSKNCLKPGDEITVVGYRAKNGSKILRSLKVTLPNGQEVNATGIED
jgi:Family of unknown function (DUF6152)